MRMLQEMLKDLLGTLLGPGQFLHIPKDLERLDENAEDPQAVHRPGI